MTKTGADTIGGTPRATQRPAHVQAPAHWQASAPPLPAAPATEADAAQPGGRNPVRYGDWEYKGLAIDF
ncbi:MAG: hypothetical protein RLZZ58_2097 [Pseudomonadota bacterium]